MKEMTLDLLKQADDATVERIGREYPKQPNAALFERAYQGYLEQSGHVEMSAPRVNRHWIQIVSVAACCLLIVGAACMWRIPQHQIPSMPVAPDVEATTETKHAETESATDATQAEQISATPSATAIQSSTDQSEVVSPSPAATEGNDTALIPKQDPTEPRQPSESSEQPQQSDPTESQPSTGTLATEATNGTPTEAPTEPPEGEEPMLPTQDPLEREQMLEYYEVQEQGWYHTITYRDAVEPSPEPIRVYTPDPTKCQVIWHQLVEGEESLMLYRIRSDDPSREIYVFQKPRSQFSVCITGKTLALYPVNVAGHPAIHAYLYEHKRHSLDWDDGCYQFCITDNYNDYAFMMEIAEAFCNQPE